VKKKRIKAAPVEAAAKLREWPEINMRHITLVTKEILERLVRALALGFWLAVLSLERM
jgi:hypothetical protein